MIIVEKELQKSSQSKADDIDVKTSNGSINSKNLQRKSSYYSVYVNNKAVYCKIVYKEYLQISFKCKDVQHVHETIDMI